MYFIVFTILLGFSGRLAQYQESQENKFPSKFHVFYNSLLFFGRIDFLPENEKKIVKVFGENKKSPDNNVRAFETTFQFFFNFSGKLYLLKKLVLYSIQPIGSAPFLYHFYFPFYPLQFFSYFRGIILKRLVSFLSVLPLPWQFLL